LWHIGWPIIASRDDLAEWRCEWPEGVINPVEAMAA
jgi:hypothetical protein